MDEWRGVRPFYGKKRIYIEGSILIDKLVTDKFSITSFEVLSLISYVKQEFCWSEDTYLKIILLNLLNRSIIFKNQ